MRSLTLDRGATGDTTGFAAGTWRLLVTADLETEHVRRGMFIREESIGMGSLFWLGSDRTTDNISRLATRNKQDQTRPNIPHAQAGQGRAHCQVYRRLPRTPFWLQPATQWKVGQGRMQRDRRSSRRDTGFAGCEGESITGTSPIGQQMTMIYTVAVKRGGFAGGVSISLCGRDMIYKPLSRLRLSLSLSLSLSLCLDELKRALACVSSTLLSAPQCA